MHARKGETKVEVNDLQEAIEVLVAMRREFEKNEVLACAHGGKLPTCRAWSTRSASAVLINLLRNGMEAMRDAESGGAGCA